MWLGAEGGDDGDVHVVESACRKFLKLSGTDSTLTTLYNATSIFHVVEKAVDRHRRGGVVDLFNPTTKTQAALTSALQAATAAGNPQITPPIC